MSTNAITIERICARIQKEFGVNKISGVAAWLDIAPLTLYADRHRGRIPYSALIAAAQKHAISLDWLLLGEGAPARGGHPAAPPPETPLIDSLDRYFGALRIEIARLRQLIQETRHANH